MELPSSDSDLEEEPPRRQGYRGYAHDEIDEEEREKLAHKREKQLVLERSNPDRARTRAANAESYAAKSAYYDALAARNDRLKRIKKGWILPNPNNPAEVELSRTREAKLDANPRKYDQRRPLDQRWNERQQQQQEKPKPNWWDYLTKNKCQICEKVDTPLSHCAECMDFAYCSQQCQMEGCGYKHL
jgi:hypothetical protein